MKIAMPVSEVPLAPARSQAIPRHAGERSAALDGIRGLAIAGVLLDHGSGFFASRHFSNWLLAPMVFGWSGVDLFFVLSGFLITGILLNTKHAVNRVSSFYARRALRIAPIYYLALISLLLLGHAMHWVNSLLPPPGWNRWAYFLYLQNIPQLWGRFAMEGPILGHFWSLAVEEQFYLIWPVIVWLLPERFLFRTCLIGACGSFILRYWVVGHFGPHIWLMYWMPTRGAQALLMGAMLAIALAKKDKIRKSTLLTMAATGFALLLLVAIKDRAEFIGTDSGPYMYDIGYVGIDLLAVALIGTIKYPVPLLLPALRSKMLGALGKYSYGIYVYHIPIYLAGNRVFRLLYGHDPEGLPPLMALLYLSVLIVITFAVAWLSFRYIENKFLGAKTRFKPRYGARSSDAWGLKNRGRVLAPSYLMDNRASFPYNR